MKKLMNHWSAFCRDESGAAAVEYALLAGLIAVVIVTSVTALGKKIDFIFNSIATTI